MVLIQSTIASRKGKAFWITVFCICLSCGTYQIFELTRYYLQVPIVTNVGIVYPSEGIRIPNITVCTLAKINGTKLAHNYPNVTRWMTDLSIYSTISPYSAALVDPVFFMRRGINETNLYEQLEQQFDNKTLVEFFEDVSFDCDKLFIKCWFENGEIFSCCESGSGIITLKRYLSHNGPCYYFESANLFQKMPGPVGGFGFVYNHPANDIYQTIFGSYDVYAIYFFTDPASAMIEKSPIMIPIGSHAHINLKASKTIKQTANVPFIGKKQCETTKNLSLFSEYSYEKCQVQCMIDTLLNSCDCTGLNTFEKIREIPLCKPHEANDCYKSFMGIFKDFLNHCRQEQCREPCEFWSYSHSITLGKVFYPGLEKAQSQYWRLPADNPMHFVMVDVYFNEILYTEVTQVAAFSLKEYLSSVGGSLGLWITIITIIDALYYFFFSFLPKWLSAEHKNGKDEEYEDDSILLNGPFR